MRDTVFMGLHVCQMMGYEDIMNSYKLITHNAPVPFTWEKATESGKRILLISLF